MRYGLGYKGSKNGIAEWVVSQFPKKKHFYDLFAGGCAITHCVMLQDRFESYFINDIDDVVLLFRDALDGKFKDERRWISREDFFALKDKEPYVKYCWSFGNNGRDYLYSKELEPYKKALHYARVFGDFSLLKDIGIETNNASRMWIKTHEEECKNAYRSYMFGKLGITSNDITLYNELKERGVYDNIPSTGAVGTAVVNKRIAQIVKLDKQSLESLESLQSLQSLESLQNLQSLERLQRLQSLESLQRLQRLESLQRLQSLQSLQRLEITQKSYDEIDILSDSLIYCDIPYRNTDGYGKSRTNSFDYEKFYSWVENQEELVIISEYSMPEDRFVKICSKNKRQSLNGKGSGKVKEEGLFVSKKQQSLYEKSMIKSANFVQLELFSEDELKAVC